MSHSRAVVTSTLIVGLAMASVSGLAAAEPAPEISTQLSVEDRLKALELEIDALHQRVSTTPRPVADTKDGFGFASADGQFRLKVWGYLQGEGRFFLNDDDLPLTNTMLLRRARIAVDGTVGPFDFRIMPDFGNGTTVLQDAYLTAPIRPWFKAQVGRSKVPIGLEFLQNDTVTLFVERAFPTQLVPNRDTGVQLFGDLSAGMLTYQVGVFNGGTDGANRDTDSSDDKDGVARITLTPVAGTTLGIAGSYGIDRGTAAASNLPTFRTSGQSTFFTYVTGTPATLANTAVADGSHWRLAPQAYSSWGALGMMAECTISMQGVHLGAKHEEISNHAWQVSAGWVLTGEKASFKGVVPASPLAFDGSGWGAFEVAARVHQLDLDDDAFDGGFADRTKSATKAMAIGAGVNWYMTKQVKLKLDFEQTAFEDGGGTTTNPTDRPTEHLIQTQLQLVF